MCLLRGTDWVLYAASLTFSNSTFCPHSVFMCFVWIWEQTAIISLYSINWLICVTETECVYRAVRTGSLYTASLTFSNSTFCPHSVFMCFVWIWEQTAIFSLHGIRCVYCAVRAEYLYIFQVAFRLWRARHNYPSHCLHRRLSQNPPLADEELKRSTAYAVCDSTYVRYCIM